MSEDKTADGQERKTVRDKYFYIKNLKRTKRSWKRLCKDKYELKDYVYELTESLEDKFAAGYIVRFIENLDECDSGEYWIESLLELEGYSIWNR